MRRRGRGQHHRKPGQHHHQHHHHQGRNQTFDSNGPSVRLRGSAHQIYEKYLTLGRDAAASGDRIMSENYFQHADHYYRYILANQGPLEEFRERGDGPEGDLEAEANGYGQGEQPGEVQQPQAYGSTVPQSQGFNGAGASQGTSLPGSNQPRGEGPREGRADDRRGDDRGEGQQGGQGQQHGNFRRDRFNRRFRNRDDRGRDDRPYQDQGERSDRGGERNDRGGERRESRDDRGRDQRPQRRDDDAFEPPAFLKAERPAGETPPRDPFDRDDEQN